MKLKRIRIGIYIIVLLIVLSSCTPKDETPLSTEKSVEQTQGTSLTEESEQIPPEIIFLIQSEEALKPAVIALYRAYFAGEEPVFVKTGADLIVKTLEEVTNDHPEIFATFLWNSVMIPQNDLPEVAAFISFAISPMGQKVLVAEGTLKWDREINDQAGNKVSIDQPIYRVISTYGPSTAFIYSVGAGERLVSASYLGARDPSGAAVMEKIDPRFPDLMGDEYFSQEDFNIEQAALLNPDLIVTSARTSWIDTIRALDIPIFLYDAETIEGLKDAMLQTGYLFGPNAYAQSEAWVAYYDGLVENIKTQTTSISKDEKLSVLFTGTQSLRVASGDMYQTSMIELAGGISASSDLGGYWNDVDLEQIAIWDPDVIIVPPYGGATVEAITDSPEWQILDAVQAGSVYQMPKLVVPWDTPAPDSILGIVWLAQLLNPEIVDLNCTEEAQYFYHTFYNYQITTEELEVICSYE